MTTEKTWDYATLTVKAEEEIGRCLEFAARFPGHSFENSYHKSAAYGVFKCWDCMTYGWQKPGDAQRLIRAAMEIDV